MNSIVPVAVLASLLLSSSSWLVRAEVVDFQDAQVYPEGLDISKLKGWTASTGKLSKIVEKKDAEGRLERYLEVFASANDESRVARDFVLDEKSAVVFFDSHLKPGADGSANPQYLLDIGGARIAFLKTKSGSGGIFAAVNKEDGSYVVTKQEFALDEKNSAREWVRVTVRSDFKSGVWDLFLDGVLALHDLPVLAGSDKGRVTFYPTPSGSTWIDDIQCVAANPLFKDSDNDAIPDAVEVVFQTLPLVADRNAKGPDGLSSIQKFERLSAGLGERTEGGADVIYVDNRLGDDANDGRLSYPQGGFGPKATLQSALRSLGGSGGNVVIMESGLPYRLDPKLINGSITFTPVGEITINPE